MDIDITQQIDEALETLPREAKDFLYKGAFTQAITDIGQTYHLTEDQKKGLDYHVTQLILLLERRNDIISYIQTLSLSSEDQQKLLLDIEQKIVMPLIVATNYIEEGIEEEEKLEEKILVEAPSPSDILKTIEDRLKEAKITAPVARKVEELPSSSEKSVTDNTIDPYREQV